MINAWNGLQQVSKVALAGLAVVLAVVIAMTIAGGGPSVAVTAGFVAAAAVLVVYSEYNAGKQG